jgi:hypothetical protein
MEKRKFLYYHLREVDKIKNNLIYNYINDNKIECNENSNGLLLNLSQLSDNHIDELYNLYNLKENKINYDFSKFKIIQKNEKKTKKKIYKKYDLNNLEKLILAYS